MDSKDKKQSISGTVISSKMNNTVVVSVETTQLHPKYNKVIKRSKKYYAHDPSNDIQEGQKVKIVATRPISKLKRWLVTGSIQSI